MYAGYYTGNYDSEKGVAPSTAPAPTAEGNIPWYKNPGFWAKTGAVGAALLPKWNRLKEAGEVASNYHQSVQLNRAQQKMLSNLAAGNDPMEGLTEQDTMGLNQQQVADLAKSGFERQAALSKLAMEERQTANTEKTGEAYRGYLGGLGEKTQFDIMKEKFQIQKLEQDESLWNDYVGEVKEGKRKGDIITAENADMFRAIGSADGRKLISAIAKEREEAKNKGVPTQLVNAGDKIQLIDTRTGVPYYSVNVGAKPGTEKGDSASIISKAEDIAFREMLPNIKARYFAKFGQNEKTAREFENLSRMIGSKDPMVAANARDMLIGQDKDTSDEFHRRVNRVNSSLKKGEGVPDVEKKTEQSPKELEGLLKHKDFEATMGNALKNKPAGAYAVSINGKTINVKTDGKGGWTIMSGGK